MHARAADAPAPSRSSRRPASATGLTGHAAGGWSTGGLGRLVLDRRRVERRAPPPRTARDLRRDEQRILFRRTRPAAAASCLLAQTRQF
jgi:hypothetical protein